MLNDTNTGGSALAVSIVIPFYNASHFLSRCLFCVTNQFRNYNYEIILVNDGSTDNFMSVLSDWLCTYSNISLITIEKQGVSAARNIGMSVALGEYIWFMDVDDLMRLYSLEPLYQIAHTNNLEILSFGNTKMSSNEAESFRTKPIYFEENGVELNICDGREYLKFTRGLRWEYACVWQYLFKRSFIQNTSVHFDEKLIYSEDLLFMWNILPKTNRIGMFFSCSYIYVNNPGSCLNSRDKELARKKMDNMYYLALSFSQNKDGIIGECDDDVNSIYGSMIEDLIYRYMISLQSHGIKASKVAGIIKALKAEGLYPINKYIANSPFMPKGIKWDFFLLVINSPKLYSISMRFLNFYRMCKSSFTKA